MSEHSGPPRLTFGVSDLVQQGLQKIQYLLHGPDQGIRGN